jgi:hypothetical protein
VFNADDPRGPGEAPPDAEERTPVETPDDGRNRVPIEGAEGWFYLPFEELPDTGEHRIKLVREDDVEVAMTLPSFIEHGDELSEIVLLVIRARERWRDLKGLGA